MRKNKRYQKETFCCSECGKNQCKYREFIGAYLCNACYSKLNIEELESVEKNNYGLFNHNNSEENLMQQKEEVIQIEKINLEEKQVEKKENSQY